MPRDRLRAHIRVRSPSQKHNAFQMSPLRGDVTIYTHAKTPRGRAHSGQKTFKKIHFHTKNSKVHITNKSQIYINSLIYS